MFAVTIPTVTPAFIPNSFLSLPIREAFRVGARVEPAVITTHQQFTPSRYLVLSPTVGPSSLVVVTTLIVFPIGRFSLKICSLLLEVYSVVPLTAQSPKPRSGWPQSKQCLRT